MQTSGTPQVFSALVLRIAYGPGFAAEPVDDATYAAQLARMSATYLLGGQAEHTRPGTSC